jgi:heat shock protein HslJ
MATTCVSASLCLVAAALAACATRAPPPAAENGLAGTVWRFVELYGTPVTSNLSPESREASLAFNAHGRLYGSDGCNRLLGSYTVQGDEISFSGMAGTQMACLPSQQSTRRLPDALMGAEHGRIDSGILTLYSRSGQAVAILERLPPRSP